MFDRRRVQKRTKLLPVTWKVSAGQCQFRKQNPFKPTIAGWRIRGKKRLVIAECPHTQAYARTVCESWKFFGCYLKRGRISLPTSRRIAASPTTGRRTPRPAGRSARNRDDSLRNRPLERKLPAIKPATRRACTSPQCSVACVFFF